MKLPNRQQSRYSLMAAANPVLRQIKVVTVSALAILGAIFFISTPVWAAPTILPSTLPEAEVNVYYTTTLVAAPITPPRQLGNHQRLATTRTNA